MKAFAVKSLYVLGVTLASTLAAVGLMFAASQQRLVVTLADPSSNAAFTTDTTVDSVSAPAVTPRTGGVSISVPGSNPTSSTSASTLEEVGNPGVSVNPNPRFVVQKFPAGFSYNTVTREPEITFSVTTEERTQDPTKLSVCATLINDDGGAMTEIRCWPLGEYGTWSGTYTGLEFSMLTDSTGTVPKGHIRAQFRFMLINGLVTDYSSAATRAANPTLSSDTTGLFDFYTPEEVMPQ